MIPRRALALPVLGVLCAALASCGDPEHRLLRDLSTQGLWRESEARLLDALRRSPRSPELHSNLAVCYEALGQIAVARQYAERARDLTGGDPGAGAKGWPVTFPAASTEGAPVPYNAIAVVPLKSLGGERSGFDAGQVSDYLHQALLRRTSLPVVDRLIDVGEGMQPAGPLQIDGKLVDGLFVGRFRFSRHDRSGWASAAQRTVESQGQPVFARRTLLRLELWYELRSLSNGSVDLGGKLSDELVYDGDGLGQQHEAFGILLAAATEQVLQRLAPPPSLEHRRLLLWRDPARQASR